MSHTVGAATASYVWDVNRSVPEILQDSTNTYVYGLGLISSTDGYTYDAFGAPTHTSGSSANVFQFTGQQTDPDSGLQYLRARYYDPSTGRFLGKDPIAGLAQVPSTQNRYPYALNNPTTFDDPTGQFCHSVRGCVKSVATAASDLATAAAPYAGHCAIGGATGFVFAGAGGSAVGCIASAGSYYIGQHISGPVAGVYQCILGGATIVGFGAEGTNLNAAIGCATSVGIWADKEYGANGAIEQCAAGALAAFSVTRATRQQELLSGSGACWGLGADYIFDNYVLSSRTTPVNPNQSSKESRAFP